MAMGESLAPREFFDKTVQEADVANPAFIALPLKDNPGEAFAYLEGYVDWLGSAANTPEEAAEMAKANIKHAAGYGVSGVSGVSFSAQMKELLGTWPRVFDAFEIVQAAKRALQSEQ